MPTRFSASTLRAAASAALVIGWASWYAVSPGPPPGVVPSGFARADPEPILAGSAPAAGSVASALQIAVTREHATASRYQLSGVVASVTAGGPGIALIAVDGAAARPVRVGAPVDGDLLLRDVSQGGALLGPLDGPATVKLEVNDGASPTSPVQLASASRTPLSFGAQASPTAEADSASQAAVVSPYAHRPRRSLDPTAGGLVMQSSTDPVLDALPTENRTR